MKQIYLLFVAAILSFSVFAQKENKPTETITITGEIVKELNISLDQLIEMKNVKVNDLVITNHLGEKKGEARKMKGVLIKEVLKDLSLKEDNPKLFSEFYFTFIASDGYKAVYSWNELFNSPTGDHVYIIVSKDGISAKEMKERILVLNTTDFKTGRRYIKGLQQIVVNRTTGK